MNEYCDVCGTLCAVDGSDGHAHDMGEAVVLQGECRARDHGTEVMR